MSDTISLRYSTEDSHAGMNAADLSSALKALNDVTEITARTFYGPSPASIMRVTSIQRGSFLVNTILEISASTMSMLPILFGSSGIKDYGDLLKSVFDLVFHLKGSAPTHVQSVDGTENIAIQNVSGDIQIFNGTVYHNCVFNDVPGKARRLVRPIKKSTDSLSIEANGKTIAKVNSENSKYFKPIEKISPSAEHTAIVLLRLKSPILEGNGDWRFIYGRNTITARMNDQLFEQEARSGRVSFRAGDLLKVRLKSTQQMDRNDARVHHSIEEVLDHTTG